MIMLNKIKTKLGIHRCHHWSIKIQFKKCYTYNNNIIRCQMRVISTKIKRWHFALRIDSWTSATRVIYRYYYIIYTILPI
jgi:hypothetical protein